MRDLISLVCETCKRKNYTSTKNKKKTTDKLAFRKYCPFCRSHVVHREGKV
jgi:large subunit ribosomal protein L33